jgi:hypothetical protein
MSGFIMLLVVTTPFFIMAGTNELFEVEIFIDSIRSRAKQTLPDEPEGIAKKPKEKSGKPRKMFSGQPDVVRRSH